MHIRPATSADARILAEVYVESFVDAYLCILEEDILEGVTVEEAERRIRRSLKAGARIWVAVHKREGIVGFISIAQSDGSFPEYPYEIERHFVLPSLQRRGLGRRLLEHAAAETIPNGRAPLLIWLPTRLQACSFFQHVGGQLLGTRPATIEGKVLEVSGFGVGPRGTTLLAN
ncbi:MAG TPA: GNAT family N-acetyltransferase [Planctomycetota bacterium]|nr:GNAT family N-acetyltransferase [Planctomycetota bacterium]